jgi:hypothetical protein
MMMGSEFMVLFFVSFKTTFLSSVAMFFEARNHKIEEIDCRSLLLAKN